MKLHSLEALRGLAALAVLILPLIGPLVLGGWIAGTVIQTWFGAPLLQDAAELLTVNALTRLFVPLYPQPRRPSLA